MAIFGDWDGDGDVDEDDDLIEMLAIEDAMDIEERKNGGSGGGCLTSFAIMLSPVIVLAIITGTILTSCGSNSPDSVNEDSVAEVEAQPDVKDNSVSLAAYQTVLRDFVSTYTLPDIDGSFKEDFEMHSDYYDISDNEFAIADIDADGREELIFYYTTTDMAGMAGLIYDYNFAKAKCYLKFTEFPAMSFYENGTIEAGWSHNQGWAGDFWPYTLYTYDSATDTYTDVGSIDAYDAKLYEDNKENWDEENAFPYDKDLDGNGFVYFILDENMSDYQDLSTAVDDAEYLKWLNQYTDGTEKIDIEFKALTEENIAAIGQ